MARLLEEIHPGEILLEDFQSTKSVEKELSAIARGSASILGER